MSDLNTAILGVLADSRDQARAIERASTQDRPAYAAAPGTVTSVALTLPAIFSVTGSPITTAGTLAATLASQSANLVFAGPSTGAAAAPTFRSLVAADLPAGTGTVTSVALSLPAIFSVSGSPVTGSGTLSATLATQTANYIWAGPTSGGAATPTFRAMVSADIPSAIVTYAKIQNVTTARLLGRTTAGAGVVEEISVGAGLTLSGGVLDVAGGGAITGSGTDTYITRWTGASSIGDSNLYLSSGILISTTANSGLKVIRTGANAGSIITADASFGYSATLELSAVDRDGGGATARRAILNLDSAAGTIEAIGNIIFHTDATYDIGASGATRARDLYLSRSMYAASIKLLGATSGTATISPLAVAGTPSLALPTISGTFALISDITTAVSGTAGSLAKFTSTNVVGNATIADIPQRQIVTRSLTSTIGNYVQIGTWTAAVGSHNLRVSVTVENAGVTSIAKAFIVSTKYDQTAGAWHIVPALTDSGLYNADFQLIASQSGAALALRLFIFNGGGGVSSTYTVDMENVGYSTDTFAAASSASTMTAPTVTLASATDYHAIRGGITLVKTIPTTVGNYVEICQLVNGLGGNPFRISISNSDSGFSNSKQYVIASSYGATAGWVIVAPISDSKYTTAQDYELLINQGGGTTYFRLIRTAGTNAGTAYVQIQWDGAYAGAYGEMTGTGSMAVPTTYAPHNVLSQVGGAARVLGGYLSGNMDTMTYATTITLDVTAGNLHKTTTVHATGDATINASGVGVAGQHMWILIVNDATSGKVITFGTNFKSTGTLTGTASKQATIHFISDGVSWSEVARTLAL